MKTIIVVSLLAVLSGCASVKESYGPDGRKSYVLNCSGQARGWDKCQAAAGNICGSAGYSISDRSSEESSSFNAGANSNGAFATGSRSNERSMMITCNTK